MILGLIFTFLTGLFFLIGILLFSHSKYQERISLFIFALAFVVMAGLLVIDIIPSVIEVHKLYLILFVLLGFFLFIFIDHLIPHHHHEHKHCDYHDHEMHLNHVGIITIIALGIHNMLEGLTLYNITVNNYVSGALMMLSISLHNIPLGLQIGNSIKDNKNGLLLFFLCTSSLLGALIVILFGSLNTVVLNILLSLTLGMLLYILFFELFNEIKQSLKKKEVIYGIIIGIVIVIITLVV